MPKTVALHSSTGALAKYLSERGYKVVDYDSISKPGVSVDAVLCTGYHPDILASHSSFTERVDISLGNIRHDFDNDTCPMSINITGMGPSDVESTLISRLERHSHRRS